MDCVPLIRFGFDSFLTALVQRSLRNRCRMMRNPQFKRELEAAKAETPMRLAIAATAAAHGLTVLTANLRHFAPLGGPALKPLES